MVGTTSNDSFIVAVCFFPDLLALYRLYFHLDFQVSNENADGVVLLHGLALASVAAVSQRE